MTKPLNILVANPFAQVTSGNDEALMRLMAKIDRDRFRFVVAQPGESPYSDAYRHMGAIVETIPMSIIRRDLSHTFLLRYFRGFLPTIYRFIALIRRHSVDIVHTNTTQILGAGAAARLMGLPSIYHVHSVSIEKPEWVSRLLATWVSWTGDMLLSNSRASGGIFLKRGFPPDKFVALGNPIDPKEYGRPGAREEVRRELGLGDGPLIGLVGRIARVKSIEYFINAAAICAKDFPSARFIVVGGPGTPADSAYFEELKKQVNGLGLNDKFSFIGRRNDVPRIMAAIDVLTLTSSSEGFGLVLIEAMAGAVPVVGSRVGGVAEIISDGEDGFLVPYGDAHAIADSIKTLLKDPARAKRMGQAGREKVTRLFSSDRLAKQLEGIYLSLVRYKMTDY